MTEDLQLKEMIAARFDRSGSDNNGWNLLAEAGVLGICIREEFGGLGLSPRDGFPVLEALAERAIALPYLETALLGGLLLGRAGDKLAATWLPKIAAGQAQIALAWLDDAGGAHASREGDGWRLDGRKILAVGAAQADAIIVTTRHNGGLAAFLLLPEALSFEDYPTIDGRRAADIRLEGTYAADASRLDISDADLNEILDIGAAAIAAEASAIMARLVQDTRDYCKQREQFGQPISSFQVIQHRLVDMHIEARRAAAAAALAADALTLAPAIRAKAISAAKVTIADAGRFVGQNAVQLHGGMGMTEELAASALFKRLTVIEGEFGSRDDHLVRYMELT